jgi:polyhydroxybutyrate depolymerase
VKRHVFRILRFTACLLALAGIDGQMAAGREPAPAPGADRRMVVGARDRGYRLHVPPRLDREQPVPLVLVFHGGGGDPAGTERLTRFSELADREGFLVVYPEGVGRNWNDGRENPYSGAFRDAIDDVAFVAALLDSLAAEFRIDLRRVYATGISNGAIFSHFLAANLSSRIAAIAPVAGSIAVPFDARFGPAQPVSVLIINGTEDPLLPYQGGGVAGGRRGRVIAVEEGARKWAGADGCTMAPESRSLADAEPGDGCRVLSYTWNGCRSGTQVVLYRLDGAGHTWPGGAQYLPDFIIGKVCKDIDGAAEIWKFFKAHPKPERE